MQVRNTYIIQWALVDYSYVGVGMKQGDWLVIGWVLEGQKSDIKGCHLMKIQAGGKLAGTWIGLPGAGAPQPEEWTFLRPLPKGE